MKKNVKIVGLIIGVLLCFRNAKAGICTPSNFVHILSTQAAVDSFPIYYPGCTDFDGSITISGNNITNLNGLSNLQYIRRDFIIENNPILSDLTGLGALIKAGDFSIDNNPTLINLNGLNSLEEAKAFIVINNSSLVDLSGLTSVKTLKYLGISYNSHLLNLNALNNLDSVELSVSIEQNPALISLQGLRNLRIAGSFSVSFNPLLANLNELENLKSLIGLTVDNSNAIINLYGLRNLHYLLALYITNNKFLKDIKDLNGLRNLNGLVIDNNPSLINLTGLDNITKLRSECRISNNASLVNLKGINNIDSIGWDLDISSNNKLVDLTGLDHLNIVSNFSIRGNLLLENLNGLSPSIRIDRLFLYDNIKLNCCYIAKQILENNPQISVASIYNNDNGCNSESEIRSLLSATQCCAPHVITNHKIICAGEHINVGIHTYSTTGTYKDTVYSTTGCDSIITTNLTVRPKSYQIIQKDLCIGQQFTLSNGKVITTTGIYKDTIQNICDSIIEFRINFLNNISTTLNPSICKGIRYTLPNGKQVLSSGIYIDTLQSSFGCDSIITTNLAVTMPVPFSSNISICSGKTYTLTNGVIVENSGIYIDTIVRSNLCDSIVITNLTVIPNTFTIQLPTLVTINQGDSVQLIPIYNGDNAVEWSWSPSVHLNCINCEQPIAAPSENSNYFVVAMAQNGCTDTASTQIIVNPMDVYIPSAFSPNNDGVNDEFTIFVTNPKVFNLKIFNRWGQIVFESNSPLIKWNGQFQGEEVPLDSYVYVLDGVLQNAKKYHKEGIINVIK